jgi:glyoxylase-like metal-dependent hydrolase (beta-lactamase superfamily II)
MARRRVYSNEDDTGGIVTGIQLTVHRATQQIGGNCVELNASNGHRIILDAGRPLDASRDARHLLPKSLDLNAAVDGILITNAYQDHYGLLEDVPAHWPIYSGAVLRRFQNPWPQVHTDTKVDGYAARKSGRVADGGYQPRQRQVMRYRERS